MSAKETRMFIQLLIENNPLITVSQAGHIINTQIKLKRDREDFSKVCKRRSINER